MSIVAAPEPSATALPAAGPGDPRSAPRAGRAFTTEASRWSDGVLHAEELVVRGLAGVSPAPSLSTPAAVRFGSRAMGTKQRTARRLIAAWLTGVLAEQIASDASLSDAEYWLTGVGRTAARLPSDCSRHTESVLGDLVRRTGALEMLPYALDPIPHEYRRDLVHGQGTGAARAARKASGSFYTPTDVTDHIVQLAMHTVNVHAPDFRLLDPAAGTGTFLRSAFAALLQRDVTADVAIRALHGIDIDECSVEMAAFVLMADFMCAARMQPAGPVLPVWSDIRSRLVAADTLSTLRGARESAGLFETLHPAPDSFEKSFDVIVGNPPYARVGPGQNLRELAERYRSLEGASSSSDLYPAFVELLCSKLKPNGAGSMVVPMSIAYSTARPLRRLRETAVSSGGRWMFEFFDRTPDALFGDDVKQRTAIVTRLASDDSSLCTGPVMRWTSRNRKELFTSIPRIELDRFDFSKGIPKLGSRGQAATYKAVRSLRLTLAKDILDTERMVPPVSNVDDATVYVAGTAYNWLSIYRNGLAVADETAKPTTSPVLGLSFASATGADATYALLSSRFTYWLWRVEGDSFHVTSGWLANLPLATGMFTPHAVERLADHGRALWAALLEHPVVSVNGGKTTLSYCPHSQPRLLDAVDREILVALNLPISFGVELTTFVRALATAGRDSQTEHGLRRALASWRED